MIQNNVQLEERGEAGPRSSPKFSALLVYSCLAAYSLLLLLSTSYIASHRDLWWDEIITHFVATLPSFSAIWNALLSGVDAQPPLFYVFTHGAVKWFGTSELALRLPSIFAYWLATLLVFLAVRRRTTPLDGLTAALLLTLTASFAYAYEARPYALVLLFTSAAFAAWQSIRDRRLRPWALLALSLSLSAAISVHYNANLILAPFLAGEMVYAWCHRRVDWWSMTSICSAVWPLLLLRPHLTAIHAYASDYWGSGTFAAVQEIYSILFSKPLLLTVVAFCALCVLPGIRRRSVWKFSFVLGRIPAHELVGASAFLLLPLLSLALSFYTKAMHFRYVIATCIGAVIAISFVLSSVRPRTKARFVVPCLVGLEVLHVASGSMRWPQRDGWGTKAGYSELLHNGAAALAEDPLVLGTAPHLVVLRYGSPSLREHCYYIITAKHNAGHVAIIERGLHAITPHLDHVSAYADFKAQHHSFQVYDPDPWFLQELVAEGDRVQAISVLGKGLLYSVETSREKRHP